MPQPLNPVIPQMPKQMTREQIRDRLLSLARISESPDGKALLALLVEDWTAGALRSTTGIQDEPHSRGRADYALDLARRLSQARADLNAMGEP